MEEVEDLHIDKGDYRIEERRIKKQEERIEREYQTVSAQLAEATALSMELTDENNKLTTHIVSLSEQLNLLGRSAATDKANLHQLREEYEKLFNIGRNQLQILRSENAQMKDTIAQLQMSLDVAEVRQTAQPQPRISDNRLDFALQKFDQTLPSAEQYKVTQIFPYINTSELWTQLYSIIVLMLDIQNSNEYSPDRLKILLVLMEGGMRGYSDTAVSEAIAHIEANINNELPAFRLPLIVYTKMININLQSLMNLNMEVLYKRQNDLYPKLAANRVFSRNAPLPALNTYTMDKNLSKTSIYVYDESVLDTLKMFRQK